MASDPPREIHLPAYISTLKAFTMEAIESAANREGYAAGLEIKLAAMTKERDELSARIAEMEAQAPSGEGRVGIDIVRGE